MRRRSAHVTLSHNYLIRRHSPSAARGDRAVIAVTHDLDMAERMDRRVRLIDGRIVADTVQTDKTPAEAEPVK